MSRGMQGEEMPKIVDEQMREAMRSRIIQKV
jgi:hypothetical protein